MGDFGADVRACAQYLLRKGVVDFMATDAHSARNRQPVLSESVKEAAKIIGKDRALRLVTKNPEAVLEGRTMDEG